MTCSLLQSMILLFVSMSVMWLYMASLYKNGGICRGPDWGEGSWDPRYIVPDRVPIPHREGRGSLQPCFSYLLVFLLYCCWLVSWPATMSGPAVVILCVVRLSVTCEYLKLSEIDIWLLGNSNRKPGFPIQSAIRFAMRSTVLPFWVFPVGTSTIQTEMGRLG